MRTRSLGHTRFLRIDHSLAEVLDPLVTLCEPSFFSIVISDEVGVAAKGHGGGGGGGGTNKETRGRGTGGTRGRPSGSGSNVRASSALAAPAGAEGASIHSSAVTVLILVLSRVGLTLARLYYFQYACATYSSCVPRFDA